MRFVDGQQRDAEVLQPLGGSAEVKTLRCDIEELELPALNACQSIRDLIGRECAVDEGGREASARERIDLVLHQ